MTFSHAGWFCKEKEAPYGLRGRGSLQDAPLQGATLSLRDASLQDALLLLSLQVATLALSREGNEEP